MRKRYTIEARGLVLGHCDGTMHDVTDKARRLASGYRVEVDIYEHKPTRAGYIASMTPQGELVYPVQS